MKTLECNYNKWGGKEVVPIPLKDLRYGTTAPENEEFYINLKNDIEKDCMHDPIIVVPTTKAQLNRMSHSEILSSIENNPIDWGSGSLANIVITGNNRMLIADELGYDSIDCVLTTPDDYVEVARIRKTSKMETDSERNNRK